MGKSDKVLGIFTDDLKRSAPAFHTQAVELLAQLTELQGKMAKLGEPWGGDEYGAEFFKHYKKSRKSIERAVAILVSGLSSIHLAMTDMADGHIENDELVGSMFDFPKGYKPPTRPVKPEVLDGF
ncbi:hypothetical protein AB0939_06910 [Streptomyces sp. NPDC006990]|uniref:hypothetical protein n=1 Tax=unclassified Streptomyces TaxID=2593676 RepID=UPI0034545950